MSDKPDSQGKVQCPEWIEFTLAIRTLETLFFGTGTARKKCVTQGFPCFMPQPGGREPISRFLYMLSGHISETGAKANGFPKGSALA
ncbi:hypothetical protein GDI3482 [Gluconacetobacter diazotrophicus PA1 5]|uniref:Uncharacterized protein n=1 Tax=Gluconacetobacter diazotrophicus (strain ATCC 49037 / DSM 5601 / CCUG 37298 / CIP 103539 / LMG 7603 / PAl5) TaxID=272568 RepID=A9H4E0_GLUDA|nr:hypothetical protein GDI3482 [Gluconacetobacter diazotrophicus PA1 5]